MKKQVQVLEYALPINVTPLAEGGYLARCENLQGCMAEGKTIDQALAIISDVARNIIDLRKEEGLSIPLKLIKKIDTKSPLNIWFPLIYQSFHA